jgi:hypothetical protein
VARTHVGPVVGSYNERLQLESDICDLDKKIADEKIFLGQKELALKYSDDNVETSCARWLLHQKNHRHMRTQADIVDIKEFKGTLHLLRVSKDEYDENVIRNSELRGAASHYRASIEEATAKRDRLKAVLNGYGEILQFKPRTT